MIIDGVTTMNIKSQCIIVLLMAMLIPWTGIAAETLSLEESIDIALKNSLTLNIAKEGVKSAEAQKREAFTGFLPKMSTSYSYKASS